MTSKANPWKFRVEVMFTVLALSLLLLFFLYQGMKGLITAETLAAGRSGALYYEGLSARFLAIAYLSGVAATVLFLFTDNSNRKLSKRCKSCSIAFLVLTTFLLPYAIYLEIR